MDDNMSANEGKMRSYRKWLGIWWKSIAFRDWFHDLAFTTHSTISLRLKKTSSLSFRSKSIQKIIESTQDAPILRRFYFNQKFISPNCWRLQSVESIFQELSPNPSHNSILIKCFWFKSKPNIHTCCSHLMIRSLQRHFLWITRDTLIWIKNCKIDRKPRRKSNSSAKNTSEGEKRKSVFNTTLDLYHFD
jgi:hypothetical protein